MTAERFDLVGSIMAYEQGDLDAEGTLDLFGHLIETGQAWTLQGHYGRTARDLIDAGYVTPEGSITDKGREVAA